MGIKLAIYGYDTDIGQLVLETLNEQALAIDEIFPLSPLQGEYDAIKVNGTNYFVQAVDSFDFTKANIALFLTTKDESERLVKKAKEAKCTVIDNSRLFSNSDKLKPVIPEINPYDIKEAMSENLVVPPLASTLQVALLLNALHNEYGVDRATICALESVSEHGRLGTQTLAHETTLLLNGMSPDHQGFEAQLAFNLHNRVGEVLEDGYCMQESIIKNQLQKVLGQFKYGLDVTCIQVPVFYGHTAIINVDLEDATNISEIEDVLKQDPNLEYIGNDKLLSPVDDIINQRKVLISRLRQTNKTGKSFSLVAMIDNSRRGEAICLVELVKLVAKNV